MNNLDLAEQSYSDVIANLQRKITFESGLKKPNQSMISIYKTQLVEYQKKEKKRLQKIALRAKCVSVFTPLKTKTDTLQKSIKEQQFYLGRSVETFIENAPDMIKGAGGTAFSHEVAMIQNEVKTTSGMCEAIT